MHSKRNRSWKGLGLPAGLAAGVVLAASILAAGTANGAGQRATAAAIDVTQTCSPRVQPNATIQVQATVANTGDVQIQIPAGPRPRRRGHPARRHRRFHAHTRRRGHQRKPASRPGRDVDVQRLVQGRRRGRDGHRLRRSATYPAQADQRPRPLRDRRRPASCTRRDRRRVQGPGHRARQEEGHDQVRPAHASDRDPGRLAGRHDQGTITLVAGLGGGRTRTAPTSTAGSS